MSKIIWISSRVKLPKETKEKLISICDFLTPDNLSPNPPKVHVEDKLGFAILNPKSNIKHYNDSILLGAMYEQNENWHIPLSQIPDGNFALFRKNEFVNEIISDSAGSRSIWYYFDSEIFIASTSQFAIIKYIGNFKFNKNLIPWMLTTGTLGPDFSWDLRIKKLPPYSILSLDNINWSYSISTQWIEFNSNQSSLETNTDNLFTTLKKTFSTLNLDLSKWVLPLSGGYDSRGILLFLQMDKKKSIPSITWGLPESQYQKNSDGYIAKKISETFGINHKFYDTKFSDEPFAKIFSRFLLNGEGRIDHLSGYLDGFQIWNELHVQGIEGVIRGDENFGWHKVNTESDVLTSLGIKFFKDYSFLFKHLSLMGINQELPVSLQKRKGETIPQWRDRLYHQYRLQTMISSLSDLKFSYVEQIVPLLTKEVLSTTYQFPDNQRSGKIVWKNLVKNYGPKIEFASEQAIANTENIYYSEYFVNFIFSFLKEHETNEIFSKDFIFEVLNKIHVKSNNLDNRETMSLKKTIKKMIPTKLYSILKEKITVDKKVDYNQLAMRISIILMVNNTFKTK